MVETRSDRRMVTRSLHRRCRVSSPSQCDGLARLKDRSGTCRIKNDAVYEVCSVVSANFLERIADSASRFHPDFLAYRNGEITKNELIARLPHVAMIGDS